VFAVAPPLSHLRGAERMCWSGPDGRNILHAAVTRGKQGSCNHFTYVRSKEFVFGSDEKYDTSCVF
jgi:hypothetical protein